MVDSDKKINGIEAVEQNNNALLDGNAEGVISSLSDIMKYNEQNGALLGKVINQLAIDRLALDLKNEKNDPGGKQAKNRINAILDEKPAGDKTLRERLKEGEIAAGGYVTSRLAGKLPTDPAMVDFATKNFAKPGQGLASGKLQKDRNQLQAIGSLLQGLLDGAEKGKNPAMAGIVEVLELLKRLIGMMGGKEADNGKDKDGAPKQPEQAAKKSNPLDGLLDAIEKYLKDRFPDAAKSLQEPSEHKAGKLNLTEAQKERIGKILVVLEKAIQALDEEIDKIMAGPTPEKKPTVPAEEKPMGALTEAQQLDKEINGMLKKDGAQTDPEGLASLLKSKLPKQLAMLPGETLKNVSKQLAEAETSRTSGSNVNIQLERINGIRTKIAVENAVTTATNAVGAAMGGPIAGIAAAAASGFGVKPEALITGATEAVNAALQAMGIIKKPGTEVANKGR